MDNYSSHYSPLSNTLTQRLMLGSLSQPERRLPHNLTRKQVSGFILGSLRGKCT